MNKNIKNYIKFTNSINLSDIPEKFLDKELIIFYIQNKFLTQENFLEINEDFIDEDMIKLILTKNIELFRYISPKYKTIEYFKEFVKLNICMIDYIDEFLEKLDEENQITFIKEILDIILNKQKHMNTNNLSYSFDSIIKNKFKTLLDRLNIDKNYLKEFLQHNKNYFNIIPKEYLNKELLNIAIDIDLNLVLNFDPKLVDEEISYKILNIITNPEQLLHHYKLIYNKNCFSLICIYYIDPKYITIDILYKITQTIYNVHNELKTKCITDDFQYLFFDNNTKEIDKIFFSLKMLTLDVLHHIKHNSEFKTELNLLTESENILSENISVDDKLLEIYKICAEVNYLALNHIPTYVMEKYPEIIDVSIENHGINGIANTENLYNTDIINKKIGSHKIIKAIEISIQKDYYTDFISSLPDNIISKEVHQEIHNKYPQITKYLTKKSTDINELKLLYFKDQLNNDLYEKFSIKYIALHGYRCNKIKICNKQIDCMFDMKFVKDLKMDIVF